MSLPVSQYEALLAEVRDLGRKANHVLQLAAPLIPKSSNSSACQTFIASTSKHLKNETLVENSYPLSYKMESVVLQRQRDSSNYDKLSDSNSASKSINIAENYEDGAHSTTKLSVSSEPIPNRNKGMSLLYHGSWPVERTMWNSEPAILPPPAPASHYNGSEIESVVSFASSSGGAPLDRVLSSPDQSRRSSQQLEAKVDMVYSLLAMLGGQEHADMGETLLALSTSPESCMAMRQSGCVPLLVQLVQSDKNSTTRKKASQALHNLVYSNPDEKQKKRESRVLKLLEQTRAYISFLRNQTDFNPEDLVLNEDGDKHPVQTMAHLMKLSFDEGHRQAICHLGGIQTIASLIEVEHSEHGNNIDNTHCVLLRRYGCMALTNLTFGDSGNKALLCSLRTFMYALVSQLENTNDELCQVTASVLRNLSWRADSTSKEVLKEVGAVVQLMKAAMNSIKENTLKSILSALWNLSAHCSENKAEICAVEGALGFLVDMLSYNSSTKSLAIIENAGGILRNISSQIAVREDYREILRRHNCLQVLLELLKSPSLTVVSNSCGTLWNLSAKNAQDQETLWQLGAPTMLRSLNHSKHKMIAMGSSAALKNLIASRPSHNLVVELDSTAKSMDLPALPSLGARKQKALLDDLDKNLAETFENIDKDSPTKNNRNYVERSGSQEYVSLTEGIIGRESRNCKSDTCIDDLTVNFHSLNIIDQQLGKIRKNFPKTEPVDFNRKFMDSASFPGTSSSNKVPELEETFGIYTETDLDQPTDYSLRYGEDDSDSEDICSKNKVVHDFISDTVKTYCTEDTPYETPFTFSTATSMSDLREVGKQQVTDNDKAKVEVNREKETAVDDEKDHCSVEDVSENENRPQEENKPVKSEFSSGIMSPEKPIRYAEEGTPGYFSRVSSFSSLNSVPMNDDNKTDELGKSVKDTDLEFEKEEAGKQAKIGEEGEKPSTSVPEGKVVKFEEAVNYAEETPLMFSRSSSLASLDSIDQHSIHEDRESVVSDFSRLTSGIVSPSELPDSPTQTIASSPRRRKSYECPSTSKGIYKRSDSKQNQVDSRTIQKQSVFEDNVTKFKEENTPIQFSTATSLSSLTFDDNDGEAAKKNDNLQTAEEVLKDTRKDLTEKQDTGQEKEELSSKISDNMPIVSESEEDDDILAACINDGMQNNRHRQSKDSPVSSRIPTSLLGYKSPLTTVRLSTPKPNIQSDIIPRSSTIRVSDVHSDTLHSYCTEDTPAVLSHAGSQCNISNLSIVNESISSKKVDLSDDSGSSALSAENDNILAECIQSAMPKPRPKPNAVGSHKRSGAAICTSTPLANQRGQQVQGDRNSKKKNSTAQNHLMGFLAAKDETEKYAIENSPGHFSLRSSLSDLTVDGSVCGVRRMNNTAEENIDKPEELDVAAGYSSFDKNLPRRDSLSSLSVESFGSTEQEQALLEQCISSGMPKNKPLYKKLPSTETTTKRSKKKKERNVESANCKDDWNEEGNFESSDSKNEYVTSAAEITNETCPDPRPTAAGGEKPAAECTTEPNPSPTGPVEIQGAGTTHRDNSSTHSEETFSTARTKNGCNESGYETRIFEETGENDTKIDNRMLDPDAMIESLDRFTAELVSQAEVHLSKDKSNITDSIKGDTWNDDEVSLPSLSGTCPNMTTFTSSESEDHQRSVSFDVLDGITTDNQEERMSNDFSSIESNTMTNSTIIAMEATKMATVIHNKSLMTQSTNSNLQSLELDMVEPPSQMNSLTGSFNVECSLPSFSPKLVRRKKIQPGLLARRAVGQNQNQHSSLDSLCNLDSVNPPSGLYEVLDMECSVSSIPSLTSEVADVKTNDSSNVFKQKQPLSLCDLDQVNPPSIFTDVSDLNSSLADAETLFEDANTYLKTDDETTLYCDALSATPLPSDPTSSSADSTPKRTKNLQKRLTPKQKRNLTRERYKTYTVAAEMVVSEEQKKMSESLPTETTPIKTTPKERRRNDRERFHTQVLDESVTKALMNMKQEMGDDGAASIPNSPAPLRVNYAQRRMDSRDRFKTRTISESSLSPDVSSSSPTRKEDLHSLICKEANLVAKSFKTDENLLDCETLSLVSNDDDSDYNSINYRTYTKYSNRRESLPFVKQAVSHDLKYISPQFEENVTTPTNSCCDEEGTPKTPSKPKILKPSENLIEITEQETESNGIKAIRGRRKPLYSSSKPIKQITSNLVRNVTSAFKNSSSSLSSPQRQSVTTAKLPVPKYQYKKPVSPQISSRTVLSQRKGVGVENPKAGSSGSPSSSSSKVGSPVRTPISGSPVKNNKKPMQDAGNSAGVAKVAPVSKPPTLERQGTFTKEDRDNNSSKSNGSKIPTSSLSKGVSRIARPVSCVSSSGKFSSSPSAEKITPVGKVSSMKSSSADRSRRFGATSSKTFNRSPSVDCSRPSSVEARSIEHKTLPQRSVSSITSRSTSSSSISSSSSNPKKQQVSKIASLWKKVEEQKKKPQKPDSRLWIQPNKP